MSFAEPNRLWMLLAVAGAIVLVLWRHRVRMEQQRRLASPAVWNRLMGGAPATGLWRMGLWCGAALLVALALARPQWGTLPEEVSVRTRDLVLAIDVSDSMQCPDVKPNRLAHGLEIIRRALPGLGGNRIGVVVFSGEAYSLIPLTRDLEAVASFLEGIRPGIVGRPGSNFEAAIEGAIDLLPAEGEGRVVVLFSDGENLQGSVDAAAEALEKAGAGFLGVVVGTERGGPIPMVDAGGAVHYKKTKEGRPVVTRAETKTFESIAERVNGAVLQADGQQTERELIAQVEGLRTREIQTEQKPRKVERFPVFLAAAALLLVASFLLSPWRRKALAVVLGSALLAPVASAQTAPPQPTVGDSQPADHLQSTAAGSDVAWWQRLIPGGSRRLARSGASRWAAEDREGAVQRFEGAARLDPDSPDRLFDLGTALGAQGEVETSLNLLAAAEEGGVPGSAYNAGTAALAAGQADAAVELLRRALVADGANPDVKRNYELALQMQQQQQQQQDDQDEQNQDDQEQDQDQQQQEQPQDSDQQEQPTPTPNPQGQQGPAPTPTPDPNGGLFEALDRAEAEAREAMQTPVPQNTTVEKDW